MLYSLEIQPDLMTEASQFMQLASNGDSVSWMHIKYEEKYEKEEEHSQEHIEFFC